LVILLALGAALLSGCAGHAKVHTITLGSRKISTTRPLIVHFNPDKCYYWVDDKGRLCVAMRKNDWSPLGELFSREYVLSLVLDEPPAGSARNYRAERRTLRTRRRAGYTHTRSRSLGGIVAVWDYGRRTLKGRFRITALRQSYLVVTGWRNDARVFVIGEFTAVPDREKGEAILARTEEGPMARPPARPKPILIQGPPQESENDRSDSKSAEQGGQ
jgi:hypothetical protein